MFLFLFLLSSQNRSSIWLFVLIASVYIAYCASLRVYRLISTRADWRCVYAFTYVCAHVCMIFSVIPLYVYVYVYVYAFHSPFSFLLLQLPCFLFNFLHLITCAADWMWIGSVSRALPAMKPTKTKSKINEKANTL